MERVLGTTTTALLLLVSGLSLANTDLILNGKHQLNLNRPLSIVLTEELPSVCGAKKNYACAVSIGVTGRCIIFAKPSKIEYIYHELQHCAGEEHKDDY